jgi:aspartate racemase
MLLQKIVDLSPARTDQEFPEIFFHNNSAIPDRTRAIVYGETSPLDELLRSVEVMNQNKADIILLGCVTAHYYYDAVASQTSAQVLHAVQLVRQHLEGPGGPVTKAGLLATTGTVHSGLFQKEFAGSPVSLLTLSATDQEAYFMQSVYGPSGLKAGVVSEKALDLFSIAASQLHQQGAEVLIGGCTEVQIAVARRKPALPCVDAVDLLAREAVRLVYHDQPAEAVRPGYLPQPEVTSTY